MTIEIKSIVWIKRGVFEFGHDSLGNALFVIGSMQEDKFYLQKAAYNSPFIKETYYASSPDECKKYAYELIRDYISSFIIYKN